MPAHTRLFTLIAALFVAPAALLAGTSAAPLPGPEGSWTGQWVREGSVLPVEMTFSRAGSVYRGSFSAPQLRAVGIPLSDVRYQAPKLSWKVAGDETTSVFDGEIRGDMLTGSYTEGRAQGTFELTRSRTRKEDFSEADLTFHNGSVTLSGTVVLPRGKGPFPGVVCLQGSGAEGRWANRYLARAFAERGVAALIYDKRGVGSSTGDWRAAGFGELVGDAAAAVEALRSLPEVNAERVGIYGHSQGAMLSPWVAVEDPHAAFVAAGAPTGVSMAETEIYSLGNSIGIQSLPPEQRPLARKFVQAVVATAYRGAPRADLDRTWESVKAYSWAFRPPPESNFYWSFARRIADFDPMAYWSRVTVPVLLLFGEGDERVPPRESAARIADSYIRGGGSNLHVLVFPNADHSYRLQRQNGTRFAWPSNAPGYPDRLIDWVLATGRKR